MPYRYHTRDSESNYFHVYNRGNNKQNLFFVNKDYQRFIDKIFEYQKTCDIKVIAYCIMKNHFHLILCEEAMGGIARFVQKLCVSYAMYFNLKYKQSGYVFQGPYKEKIIDTDAYLLQLSAYIHNNSLEMGKKPEDYQWSSYNTYLSGMTTDLFTDPVLGYFHEIDKVNQYQSFVNNHQDQVFNLESRPGLEKLAA